MKKLKGYIFSRSFMGERVPQHIQNLVIRNFCEKNNYLYLLSAAEYAIEDSHAIFKSMVNDTKEFNGIIAYSLFQLPKDIDVRTNYIKKLIKKNIFFVSAVEQIFIKDKKDLETINKLWQIKEALKYCPKTI